MNQVLNNMKIPGENGIKDHSNQCQKMGYNLRKELCKLHDARCKSYKIIVEDTNIFNNRWSSNTKRGHVQAWPSLGISVHSGRHKLQAMRGFEGLKVCGAFSFSLIFLVTFDGLKHPEIQDGGSKWSAFGIHK